MTYLTTSVCGKLLVFGCLLVCDWVPHGLIIELGVVGRIGNGGERRRNHHSFHRRNISLDRVENSLGTVDGRVEDFLDGVGEVIVEGGGRVNDIVVGWPRFEDLFIISNGHFRPKGACLIVPRQTRLL